VIRCLTDVDSDILRLLRIRRRWWHFCDYL